MVFDRNKQWLTSYNFEQSPCYQILLQLQFGNLDFTILQLYLPFVGHSFLYALLVARRSVRSRRIKMLASPLLPTQPRFSTQHTPDDPLQYRPSKDKEAFNSLLPPPIEFVEGSSSGALAVPPGKYEPINASPKAVKPDVSVSSRTALPPTYHLITGS
jgi:hypothetical protein